MYPPVRLPSGRNRLARTLSNYKKNKEVFGNTPTGLLHGQKTKPMCDMVYGTYPLSWNGCELIAVYNVCVMLKKPVPLPQVIFEFELNKMHYLFPSGYWGTGPKVLYKFLDSHGLKYRTFRNKEQFRQAASVSSCGIVSFWNNEKSKAKFFGLDFFSGGLHTVAYLRGKDCYHVYDLYSRDTAARTFRDISEIYKEKRFIIGYTFDSQENRQS
ncbi:MAG: hypothetical protein IJ806_12080 [Ruminococcus sp.]|nr:hypothetical protein [Ruminococcus sp.]